jgi:hypothetical protein
MKMTTKTLSLITLSGLCAVLVGLMVLTGCGGGSTSAASTTTTTGTPAVSLTSNGVAITSLTFTSGVGVASSQTVTVTNSGTAALTFSGFSVTGAGFTNPPSQTCGTQQLAPNSSCTVTVTYTPTSTSSVSGSLTITDNAGGVANSTQTVTLSGTTTTTATASLSVSSLSFSGATLGVASAAQSVTLSNSGSAALTISSITITPSTFAIATNTCDSSVAAGGNCAVGVTYTANASGTIPGTLTITDNAGGVAGSTQTVTLSGTTNVSNTASVTVGFGPNGPGPVTATSSPYYDGIYTTVTVCAPGSTTNCVPVSNVLVDTGSVGLRVLSTAISGLTLPTITDSVSGYPFYECVQFADLSYTFGQVELASVSVGGETAVTVPGGTANAGIPIQVIEAGETPPEEVGVWNSSETGTNPCLTVPGTSELSGGLNDNTTATLGANGILGVGNFPQDCGTSCASLADTTGQYLICTTGGAACDIPNPGVALAQQVWNPVSTLPVDNNGVLLTLPTIPAAGQTTATGTLTFGIGTESNNAIPGSAQVYELDDYGNFASATYNGITFCTEGLATCPTNEGSGGTFIDSGSNGYYISDETTLGTTDCTISGTDIGLYCPSPSPLNITLGLAGSNTTTTTVSLPIANALSLFAANTVSGDLTFGAYNDIGGPSCIPATGSPCSLSTDSWDLGLPFFFNQGTVFVGIAGGTTFTNGYWAF